MAQVWTDAQPSDPQLLGKKKSVLKAHLEDGSIGCLPALSDHRGWETCSGPGQLKAVARPDSAQSRVTGVIVCACVCGVRRRGQMETLHPAQEVALPPLLLCDLSSHTQIELERPPSLYLRPPHPLQPRRGSAQKLKTLLWLFPLPTPFSKWI